jgi:D-alanyl-lipoteichoic acid acyltransferase DltB (MBOAT superfamily)
MLFNSIQYLIFLPTIVLLFWVLPVRVRLPMLLVASYYFYMSWSPVFILLILPMTLFNWLWGKLLSKAAAKAKLVLTVGITVNLLILGTCKYADLFVHSAGWLVGVATKHNPGWALNWILPLGISFFTFEFIHYLFEIYRGQKPIKSFVLFALFAAFFPTQIAGPIKRYPDFEAQMLADQKLKLSFFDDGVPLIVIGLAKKLLLADNLGVFVQMGLAEPTAYGAPETWLFMYAFLFQIYFDFSAYTDIARGSARLFGYNIPINFNLPFFAKNISDFWHRWHISLSSWLRDYLFIPLGGSRGGDWVTHKNMLITMGLGGLWHGASWNFLIWGLYNGLLLVIHREFAKWKESVGFLKALSKTRLYGVLSIIATFHGICLGMVFFREQNLALSLGMFKKMVLLNPIFSKLEIDHFLVLNPLLPVIVPVSMTLIALLMITNFPVSTAIERGFFKRLPALIKAAYCALLIVGIITFLPDDSRPFIYFQF